jgi:hypothetical protein
MKLVAMLTVVMCTSCATADWSNVDSDAMLRAGQQLQGYGQSMQTPHPTTQNCYVEDLGYGHYRQVCQ